MTGFASPSKDASEDSVHENVQRFGFGSTWQGQKDSNPQQRFWRPTCCHYTMPLKGSLIIIKGFSLVKSILCSCRSCRMLMQQVDATHKALRVSIGAFIAVLHKANGMTQRELAERLNGRTKPSAAGNGMKTRRTCRCCPSSPISSF